MRLWLLRRIDNAIQHNSNVAHVVRAETEFKARLLASCIQGNEGPQTWLLSDKSACLELTTDGEEAVLLTDFDE